MSTASIRREWQLNVRLICTRLTGPLGHTGFKWAITSKSSLHPRSLSFDSLFVSASFACKRHSYRFSAASNHHRLTKCNLQIHHLQSDCNSIKPFSDRSILSRRFSSSFSVSSFSSLCTLLIIPLTIARLVRLMFVFLSLLVLIIQIRFVQCQISSLYLFSFHLEARFLHIFNLCSRLSSAILACGISDDLQPHFSSYKVVCLPFFLLFPLAQL